MINLNIEQPVRYKGVSTNGLKSGHVYSGMVTDLASGGYQFDVFFDYTDNEDVESSIYLSSRASVDRYLTTEGVDKELL